MSGRKKIAVILVSHGEAETAGFVENYLVSLHTLSRASEVMAIPLPLRHLISLSSSLRKRMVRGQGSAGSPQNRITRTQADLLQRHLDSRGALPGVEFDVRAAHSASSPSFEKVLAETMGHDGQVVVPMAPVDNSLSCGSICGHIAGNFPGASMHRLKVIGRLWTDEALCKACLEHLFEGGAALPGKGGRGNRLLLLFHGTLVRDREGRTPGFRTGREETEAFARKLEAAVSADARNPWDSISTAYLNHDVGGEWTRPSFEEACREMGDGISNVSLFAAGYFSDGNETLRPARALAASRPDLGVLPVPCLNDSPVFAAYLAGRVVGAAEQILRFTSRDAAEYARDSNEEAILC